MAASLSGHQAALARALFRASLRCVKSLRGSALPLQRGLDERAWGTYQRLSPQQLEAERQDVFPWLKASSPAGSLSAEALRSVVRDRFRETPDDVDAALNEAFAALRRFGELFEQLRTSSTATTRGVRIEAVSKYLGVSDDKGGHIFAYRIRIANTGDVVQLRSRHWLIEDEDGRTIVVPKGSPGVVGQTPRLAKGAHFEYVSGTTLEAPRGHISGSFEFVDDDGRTFDATVAKFNLIAHPLGENDSVL